MHIVRIISVWASRLLLQVELLIWLLVAPLVILFGSTANLKQILDNSNIYERVPGVVLKQSANAPGEGTAALAEPKVQKLVNEAFSEKVLKGYSEIFLDGMYRWLNGDVAKPNFNIDLSGIKQTVAEGVATVAAERLTNLPACTQFPTGSLDPFVIDCLPPGINIANEKARLKNELLSNESYLPITNISAEQLPKNSYGQDFTDYAKDAPRLYQFLKILPLLLAGFGLITALAIVFLSSSKRKGVRTVGRTVLASGTFVLVVTVLFSLLLPSISNSMRANFLGSEAAQLMNDFLAELLRAINKSLLVPSGVLVILGSVILLAERFVKSKVLPEIPVETATDLPQATSDLPTITAQTEKKKLK